MSQKTLILAGALFVLLGCFICAVDAKKKDKAYYAKLLKDLQQQKNKLVAEHKKTLKQIAALEKKLSSKKKKIQSRSANAVVTKTRLCNKFGEDPNVCHERVCGTSTKLVYNSKKCLTGGCFCGSGYAYDPNKDQCVKPTPPCYSEKHLKQLLDESSKQLQEALLLNATDVFKQNYGGLYNENLEEYKSDFNNYIRT